MNYRLKIFIDEQGISHKEFSEKIGVSRQQLEGWLNQNVKVPIPSLQRIANEYQDLNTRWLLTGNGHMSVSKSIELLKNQFEIHNEKRVEIVTDHLGEKNVTFYKEIENKLVDVQNKYIELLERIVREKDLSENLNNNLKNDGD